MMMSVSGQIPAIDRIAGRHPGLKLVIDHLGLRSGTKGEQTASLPLASGRDALHRRLTWLSSSD